MKTYLKFMGKMFLRYCIAIGLVVNALVSCVWAIEKWIESDVEKQASEAWTVPEEEENADDAFDFWAAAAAVRETVKIWPPWKRDIKLSPQGDE